MYDESRARPGHNRRFGLTVGFGLGVGMVVGKGLEKLLSESLGEWGAFGVGLLLGTGVAAGVGLLVAHLLGRTSGHHH